MDVDGEIIISLAVALAEFDVEIRKATRGWLKFARAARRIYSGPPKLCIDGHEYRRRQRRRSKRK